MADVFEQLHDVLIAGSGPAGLTAAIYASRAGLTPVMVYGEEQGGQLTITTDVENYPGFPKGIMGPELIEQMRLQAERFGTQFVVGKIESVDLSKRPFKALLDGNRSIQARTLVIATGASARLLGLPEEMEFMKKLGGVSACATCDGYFFKGKEVVVIGGGDTAMEEANYLAKLCSKVTVIHRRDKLRASQIMQDRALKNPKIVFKWNAVVEKILDLEKQKVSGVRLRSTVDNSTEDYACDGVFTAIGHDPNTKFLGGQIETDAHGFIKTQSPTTKTNIPGVFACGDVMDPSYKQAITAAGTGCSAALDAERFLASEQG